MFFRRRLLSEQGQPLPFWGVVDRLEIPPRLLRVGEATGGPRLFTSEQLADDGVNGRVVVRAAGQQPFQLLIGQVCQFLRVVWLFLMSFHRRDLLSPQ